MTESDSPRSPAGRDDRAIEQALRDLGAQLAYPPMPDLAASVRQRLAAPPTTLQPGRRLPTAWRWAALAAVVVAIVAAALAFSPAARTVVADRLGLRGVAIRFLEGTPPVEPSPGGALRLGRRVSLAEANAEAPFPLALPTAAGFAAPDAIYLSGAGDSTVVWFVYRPRPGLDASAAPGVGALLAQFRGTVDRPLMAKLLAGDGTPPATLDMVAVNSEPGFWISGAPHFFAYRGVSGRMHEEPFRLAGNVLLWEHGDVTFRLESTLDKDAALAVARSVAPPRRRRREPPISRRGR